MTRAITFTAELITALALVAMPFALLIMAHGFGY